MCIKRNAVHLTVRGELDVTTSHSTKLSKNDSQVAGYVEPPATQPEPFDKLRANGNFLKWTVLALDVIERRNY